MASVGATRCDDCLPGKYQSRAGAEICEGCPKATYAANTTSFGCNACPIGMNSAAGSSACDLATEGWFLDPAKDGATEPCPENADCFGGRDMPRPRRHFWVDRSDVTYAAFMYPCSRSSCVGASSDGIDVNTVDARRLSATAVVNCWSIDAYNSSSLLVCDPDALQCSEGSTGPLCKFWFAVQ